MKNDGIVPLVGFDTFMHFDASGVRSEHPRPRCACGGIFDPHHSKDAAVCRDCGTEVTGEEHFRSMREIVSNAQQVAK